MGFARTSRFDGFKRQIAALDEIANSEPVLNLPDVRELVDAAHGRLLEEFGSVLAEAALAGELG